MGLRDKERDRHVSLDSLTRVGSVVNKQIIMTDTNRLAEKLCVLLCGHECLTISNEKVKKQGKVAMWFSRRLLDNK